MGFDRYRWASICVVFTLLLPPLAASGSPSEGIAARLDARAEHLQSQLVSGRKLGAVQRQRLRSELREVNALSERIAAGERPDSSAVAEVLARPGDEKRDRDELALTRREVLERRLDVGPKIGAMERIRIRDELQELDRMIADLEAGRSVDVARLDDLLGRSTPAAPPRTPEEKRRALEIERASLEREMRPSPKKGALERSRIRAEIDMLDRMISDLESRN